MNQLPDFVPTLEEIAAETAEIRATWDDDTRERRAVTKGTVPWRPPGADRHSEIVDRADNP
jgi:hypothetical protein